MTRSESAARGKAGPLLGSLVFFVVAPGTVVGLIPYVLTRWHVQPPFFGQAWLRVPGAVMVVAGVAVLIDSFLRFALEGRGTPSPIVPANLLVVSGLYRYVRNPMYVALLSIVLGQALVLGSTTLVWYAAMLGAVFHLFVLLYEERVLCRRFGRSYEVYAANVRRWLPRLTPWRGQAEQPLTVDQSPRTR